jgi:signal transduction histidine kinase/CheY-like chemotaxis protein
VRRGLAARPDEARRLTLRIRRRDGAWRWVEGVANNLLAEPSIEGIVVNWWDITPRLEADAERQRLEAQVRQAQKMEAIGRLAGGIAHDFNNLLTVISGRAQILLRRAGSTGAGDVDLIYQTAKRAAQLTRQLLAFSRRQTLRPEVLSLNDRLTSLLPMLRRLIGEDIQIVTGFQQELGLVKVDPSQLEQVVLNLAVNARDAMPRGGRLSMETANVELDESSSRRHPDSGRGPHVMIRITDTGVGMTPDVVARVFEPFFTTKGVGRGTGLGLSTTYGIVKQHGGFITVESEPGQGTAFCVYFPRAADATPVRPPAHRERPVGPARGETVLLVEDETEVRRLARSVLEDCGYKVLEASGPEEASRIATYHANGIDLLLTDVVMPSMSGRELAERVCVTRPTTKVLYLSGYTDEALGVHGILTSDVAFLQKPFTLESLACKVREVLDGVTDRTG